MTLTLLPSYILTAHVDVSEQTQKSQQFFLHGASPTLGIMFVEGEQPTHSPGNPNTQQIPYEKLFGSFGC